MAERSRRGRRIALAAAGAPAAIAGLLAGQIWLARNAEYLPAPAYRVDATAQPAQPVVDPSAVRLVVFGDSTSAGIGSATPEESLPMLLAQRVADRLGRPVAVTGYAVSGARTEDVRTEQLPLLAGVDVDALVVVIGANDVTHAAPFWRMRARTAAMLDAAIGAAGAPVVFGGIPEFANTPALRWPLRRVAGVYADVLRRRQRDAAARDGVRFVDIAAEASPRFLGIPESMSSDGFHPSEVGYGFWADALAPAVVQALAD